LQCKFHFSAISNLILFLSVILIISALENLEENGDTYSTWDAITANAKISAKECIDNCEAKRHKSWFDEECSKFIDQRK
jgi:hypothetical protein